MNINNTSNVDLLQMNSDSLKNTNTKNLEDKELRKVADDFESFFMQQIMDVSLKSNNIAGEGAGSDIIKGMYTQTISQQTAGSLGISDLLYNFLSKNNKI